MSGVDDLTLGEVEEARKYGITAPDYLALKVKFTTLTRRTMRDEIVADAKAGVEAELRPKIEAELHDKLLEKVTAELGEKMYAKARDSLLADKPGAKERQALREYVREVEIDALTNARAASMTADGLERGYARQMVGRLTIFYTLLIGFCPVGYWMLARYGGHDMIVAAMLLPWAIAFVAVWNKNSDFSIVRNATIRSSRGAAASYWRIAEQAKRLHMVEAECAVSRREMRDKLDELVKAKGEADKLFTPDAAILDASRKTTRDMLLVETDTREFFRIGSPDGEPENADSESSSREVTGGT